MEVARDDLYESGATWEILRLKDNVPNWTHTVR